MCGIVGGYDDQLVEMLCRIQHRGFTQCGFVTDQSDQSEQSEQYAGRVHELLKVKAPGVGHVRYATQDSPPQPFQYKDSWLAFNGEVEDGDTEALAQAIYHGWVVKGAYSFVWMCRGQIFAGRDPNGFRPLYYALRTGSRGLVAASETVADPSLEWREVCPGEMINLRTGETIDMGTNFLAVTKCCFEDVYFKHIASRGVWARRRELGHLLELPEADAIVPVPDSAIAAAEAASATSGIPIVFGIMKNRYSERTFLAESGHNAKYTVIPDAIYNRRIIVVDDSIVRGDTMRTLVPELKKYAKEVHVRVTFPQIKYACKYGVRITGPGCGDIPAADSVKFLDSRHFSGCKACVDGVYLAEESQLPDLGRFFV